MQDVWKFWMFAASGGISGALLLGFLWEEWFGGPEQSTYDLFVPVLSGVVVGALLGIVLCFWIDRPIGKRR